MTMTVALSHPKPRDRRRACGGSDVPPGARDPQMPRTYGDNQVHISQIAGWCTADYPLHEVRSAAPDERDRLRHHARIAGLLH
jgi:hypothetical protein